MLLDLVREKFTKAHTGTVRFNKDFNCIDFHGPADTNEGVYCVVSNGEIAKFGKASGRGGLKARFSDYGYSVSRGKTVKKSIQENSALHKISKLTQDEDLEFEMYYYVCPFEIVTNSFGIKVKRYTEGSPEEIERILNDKATEEGHKMILNRKKV